MNKKVIAFVCGITLTIQARICEFSHPLLQAGVRYMFHLDEDPECQRHWFTQLIPYFCTSDSGFNDEGKKVDLSELIFGKQFSISDFYLASKLAAQGKVNNPQSPNEQYIALLSGTRAGVEAEQREFSFKFTTIYYDRVPGTEKLIGAFGLLLPIVHQFHVLTGTFLGGSLLDRNAANTDSLTDFFSDFQSMEDFVVRGILLPKNLRFRQIQRTTGVGDINIVGLIDLNEYTEHASGVQVGLNVVAPTGRQPKDDVVWSPELGQGAGWLFDPFFNFIFEVDHKFINPLLFFGFRVGPRFSITRRVPELKDQANQVKFTPTFAGATVSDFAEFDSSVLQLADQAIPLRVRPGMGVIMRVANFFEDVFIDNFRIGINYIYTSKSEDAVHVEYPRGRTFNTALLEKGTREVQHFLIWNVAYSTNDDEFEAYLGSQHVIAGRNVPQQNKLFASLRWQF